MKSFHIIYKHKHKLKSKNNNIKPVQCFCLNQHRSHGPIFYMYKYYAIQSVESVWGLLWEQRLTYQNTNPSGFLFKEGNRKHREMTWRLHNILVYVFNMCENLAMLHIHVSTNILWNEEFHKLFPNGFMTTNLLQNFTRIWRGKQLRRDLTNPG